MKTGDPENSERSKQLPAQTGSGLGIVIGAASGLMLAPMLDLNIALAIGIGAALGLVLGAAFDANQARRLR